MLGQHFIEFPWTRLLCGIDNGAGGVMVTHEPGDAAWADRVIILRDGRMDSVTRRDTGMLEPA